MEAKKDSKKRSEWSLSEKGTFTFSISRMQSEDYDRIYELWIASTGMGLNNLDDSREGIERFLARNPSTCFVAESDSDHALLGGILSGHDGRRGYIYHAVVHTAYRGLGIGKALVTHTLTSLKKEGISKAALVVFKKNQLGNDFWGKMGFALREDLSYRDLVLMPMETMDT